MPTSGNAASRSASPTPSINDTRSSLGHLSPSTESSDPDICRLPDFRKRLRSRVPVKPDNGAWTTPPKPDLGTMGDGLAEGEFWGGVAPGDGTILAPTSGTVMSKKKGNKRRRTKGTYTSMETPNFSPSGANAEGLDAAGGESKASNLGVGNGNVHRSGFGSVVSGAERESATTTRPVPPGRKRFPAPARRASAMPAPRLQAPRKIRQAASSMKKSVKRRPVEREDENEESEEEDEI
jgi:hypothetical protein